MFSAIIPVVLAAATIVRGAPVSLSARTSHHGPASFSHSFDNWNGISSLHGFDDFYGADNFAGSFIHDTTVVEESQVVCHSVEIEVIQQRLVVLQEIAKRVITELICEVETQTIVFEQFSASFGSFRDDLFRSSSQGVGYDSAIASQFSDLFNEDGSLTTGSLGFSGSDLGSSFVIPTGSNWDSSTSPAILTGLEDDISSALDFGSDDFGSSFDGSSIVPTDGSTSIVPDTSSIIPDDGSDTSVNGTGTEGTLIPTDGSDTSVNGTDTTLIPTDGSDTSVNGTDTSLIPTDGSDTSVNGTASAIIPDDGSDTSVNGTAIAVIPTATESPILTDSAGVEATVSATEAAPAASSASVVA